LLETIIDEGLQPHEELHRGAGPAAGEGQQRCIDDVHVSAERIRQGAATAVQGARWLRFYVDHRCQRKTRSPFSCNAREYIRCSGIRESKRTAIGALRHVSWQIFFPPGS